MMDSKEPISILCATDDNYAPYCGIMLTSLLMSNPHHQFEIYVMVDGSLSEVNMRKYRKLENKYGCHVSLITIDNSVIDACPINNSLGIDNHSWVTAPTYYRLLAARLLPASAHRVIYLDCDIVVNGDLRALWEMDLAQSAMAGALDCDYHRHCKRMHIPEERGYVNAGVAVYNLDYWREYDITERFFQYIQSPESELLLMDQDVVNATLDGEKALVPERFNFQVSFFMPLFWNTFSEDYKKILLAENEKAVVIHFCGGFKPWDFRYYGSPYHSLWERYRKHSFWRGSHVTHPTMKYVKFLLKRNFAAKQLTKLKRQPWIVLPENAFCFK